MCWKQLAFILLVLIFMAVMVAITKNNSWTIPVIILLLVSFMED
jgi:uncharacterized membrane protein (DUF441 family)